MGYETSWGLLLVYIRAVCVCVCICVHVHLFVTEEESMHRDADMHVRKQGRGRKGEERIPDEEGGFFFPICIILYCLSLLY